MRTLFSRDPLEDFLNQREEEKHYPICDCCGDEIHSDTFHMIRYEGTDLKVCNYCWEEKETEDYTE